MPAGGVDVFGCTRAVCDRIIEFDEASTNLVALLFWMGFRRQYVGYDRVARLHGKSAWTVQKKWQYCLDSVFNFTDLPIRVLSYVGAIGMTSAIVMTVVILVMKIVGKITVPGYAPIVLTITFFGALTSMGLGILGQYIWLTLQNARGRPNFIVASSESNFGLGSEHMNAGQLSDWKGNTNAPS
jgi:hypothetical protein